MRKIVIAIDSFKGCLSSVDAARAVERGIAEAAPGCRCEIVPLADGGEGTVDATLAACGGRECYCLLEGPLGESVTAKYGILPDGETAIMEMAAAAGLNLIAESDRNPWLTTTFGVGQMVSDAIRRGCHHILMGLGGSATCDGGVGLLQALGFRFLDADGRVINERGGQILQKIMSVEWPQLPDVDFTLLCDVEAPFCGPRGAAWVFAPQKGADAAMTRRLDEGLAHFARIVGHGLPYAPGSGAAGGLGGGMMAFLGAKARPGAKVLLDYARFESRIDDADLVITGEGRLDSQTLMGKAPARVLEACRKAGVPLWAIGGSVESAEPLLSAGFDRVAAVTPADMTLSEALLPEVARRNITNTIIRLLKDA